MELVQLANEIYVLTKNTIYFYFEPVYFLRNP